MDTEHKPHDDELSVEEKKDRSHIFEQISIAKGQRAMPPEIRSSEWVAEWEAERDKCKTLAANHAAYGGALYVKYISRFDAIKDMLDSWRRHSATIVLDRTTKE